MRWLDVLLHRVPPDDERTMKAARIRVLEAEALSAKKAAQAALLERRIRLAAAVDESSRTLRGQRT